MALPPNTSSTGRGSPNTPLLSRTWMRDSLATVGDRTVRDIGWLPGSHDAGMDRMTYQTTYGDWPVTQTQYYSIRGQLELGVRWFDLRPYTRPNDGVAERHWDCGHFTQIDILNIGWQGAAGETISDVINDVNSFLDEYGELVVLHITHVGHQYQDADTTKEMGVHLLTQLTKGLKHLYSKSDTGPDIADLKLSELVGPGKGCVIITPLPWDGRRINDDAWIQVTNKVPPNLHMELVKFCHTHEDNEAIVAIIQKYQGVPWPIGFSIHAMAEAMQTREMSKWLGNVFSPDLDAFDPGSSRPSVLAMDAIRDDRLLTICLAVTYGRKIIRTFNAQPGKKACIVAYGGKLMLDPAIVNAFESAYASQTNVNISREIMLHQDPWYGTRKLCVVYCPSVNANGNVVRHYGYGWDGDNITWFRPIYAESTTPVTLWSIKAKANQSIELQQQTNNIKFGGINRLTPVIRVTIPVIGAAEISNGTFSLSDNDLYFIKTRNCASGTIEVHVLTRSSNYQEFSVHTPTSFLAQEASNGHFFICQRLLYFVKVRNTSSGMVEVLRASQDFLKVDTIFYTDRPVQDDSRCKWYIQVYNTWPRLFMLDYSSGGSDYARVYSWTYMIVSGQKITTDLSADTAFAKILFLGYTFCVGADTALIRLKTASQNSRCIECDMVTRESPDLPPYKDLPAYKALQHWNTNALDGTGLDGSFVVTAT